ncbi:hypothetical protein IJ556_06405, partial [bacterium]|nr:hypothetical protein [bacterium]
MKNFLSKLWSLSRTDRVRTLAIDAVSLPSFCRVNMLKLVSVLVILLTLGVGNAWGDPTKCTSTSDLTAGDVYYISSASSYSSSAIVMAKSTGGNNYPQSTFSAAPVELTLGGNSTDGWTFSYKDDATTYYVNATSTTGSNHLKRVTSNDAYGQFTISFSNGAAVITCKGKSSRNIVRYNSGSSCFSCYSSGQAAVYLYKKAAATPTVTPDPTSLDWGTVLQGSSQGNKTISITGANLTAGTLTISATGGYSVTPTSKSVSGTLAATTLTVTPPSTSTTGAKNGKVTISGGGLASSVEVNLSMTVNTASTVTWMNNGSEYTTTLVENGSKPTFPDNPTSCDGTSTTFYGWSTSEWSGKIDDISAKTIYTSAASMPTVSGAVTYYAVFCKGGGGSEVLNEEFDNDQTTDATTAFSSSTFSNFSGETSKAYKSQYGGAKFGTRSAVGYITSKSLNLSKAF